MSAAKHTDEGELSRRQFVKQSTVAYWTAAGAAGSGMLALPGLGLAQEGSGPVDCGPPPKAKPQSRTGGESFPPCPCPPRPCGEPRRSGRPLPPPWSARWRWGRFASSARAISEFSTATG